MVYVLFVIASARLCLIFEAVFFGRRRESKHSLVVATSVATLAAREAVKKS